MEYRYKVTLYFGGKYPDEVKWTDSIDEARVVCKYATCSKIEYKGQLINLGDS